MDARYTARSEGPQLHALKTHPEFYRQTVARSKPFEVRLNDRDFRVGDFLLLKEYEPTTGQYTGREEYRSVRYITEFMQQPGWVIMGLWDGEDLNVSLTEFLRGRA